MRIEDTITNKKFIFKYRSINLNTYRTLINSELYFSAPKDFNDPFDSRFNLELENLDILGVENFYKSIGLKPKEIKEKVLLFTKNPKEIIKDIEVNYNNGLTNDIGVCCFSEKNDEILMWAHYSDNFKGICLIFDWKVHENYFQGLKVRYKNLLSTISYDGNGVFETSEALLSKLKNWEYEREIRSIVKMDGGENPVMFNPKALVGIIFGNKVNLKDKNTIKKLIKLHPIYDKFNFYNAIPNQAEQKVKIEEEY